jgi:hypothetical protein
MIANGFAAGPAYRTFSTHNSQESPQGMEFARPNGIRSSRVQDRIEQPEQVATKLLDFFRTVESAR